MIVGPHSILLDSEAMSALAADGRVMQAWATVARRTDSVLHVSAATLAEVTDGGPRDAGVRRAVKAVRVEAVTESIGFQAGRLRAGAVAGRRKRRHLTLDALVAATALSLRAPVVVLTSDPGDLELLLAGSGTTVEPISRR